MHKTIVIGIDQSYTRTGISVAADGKLKKINSTNFKRCKTKSDKRKHLAELLHKIIPLMAKKASKVVILCERIRTFSKGKGNDFMISMSYIKATAALIATIVDVAAEYGVKVYSVDTRSWKSKVVGTSKHRKKDDKKLETIEYIIKLGFEESIKSVNKKGEIIYNDDAADSACIALYGFVPKSKRSLKLEE